MESTSRIALFGESEKGEFCTAHHCNSLPQLVDTLGHPPDESHGLHFAVQALMYDHSLIFFRVEEEGYSTEDYLKGIQLLQNEKLMTAVNALCIPGVGNNDIIDAMTQLCLRHSNILITREKDLYDYLTT